MFQVQPYQGESLSHFLGRFRYCNDLTPTGLGKAAELGGTIARWEKFRFNPPPSPPQLVALAVVVGVEADRLQEMLPWIQEIAQLLYKNTDSPRSFHLVGAYMPSH